ncbi:MAG: cytochrome c biogenesis CcdA family protein [Iamia sp.]
MADPRLVVAFTAGMVATVNPCALPMLPAYLGWFISGDEAKRPAGAAVARAAVVAVSVSFGFILVFGTLGLLATAASAQVEEVTPWLTPIIGLVLAGVGVALLAGRTITLPLPRLDRGGRGRGLATMVLYGVSYAVVSVSCTLGIFLVHVSTTFGSSWTTGLIQLAAFAAGFTLVLMALSVSVALARGSLAAHARRASAYASRIGGGLLVATGLYLVWYGITEIRLSEGPDSDPLVDRVTGWSADISSTVQSAGGVEVGLVLALFVAVVALVVVVRTGGGSPRGRTPRTPR